MLFLVYVLSLACNFIIFIINVFIMRTANNYSGNYEKKMEVIKLSNNFVSISSFLVFIVFAFFAFRATKNMDNKKAKIIYFVITIAFLCLQLIVDRVMMIHPIITAY